MLATERLGQAHEVPRKGQSCRWRLLEGTVPNLQDDVKRTVQARSPIPGSKAIMSQDAPVRPYTLQE